LHPLQELDAHPVLSAGHISYFSHKQDQSARDAFFTDRFCELTRL